MAPDRRLILSIAEAARPDARFSSPPLAASSPVGAPEGIRPQGLPSARHLNLLQMGSHALHSRPAEAPRRRRRRRRRDTIQGWAGAFPASRPTFMPI